MDGSMASSTLKLEGKKISPLL